MDEAKKVSMWLINHPEEFVQGIEDLLALGFDLDRNSARALIRAAAIYKGVIKE